MFTYDVICIGSATLDHFLRIDQDLSKVKPGDKVLVTHQETHSGGSGTNSAAALSKLGLRVKLLTKLGNDREARLVLEELKKYKLKIIKTSRSRKATDSSTIISSTKNHDRIIYVHKGASGDLASSDLRASDFKAKWIYLGSLTGKSFKTGKEIATYARSHNIKLLFNPSSYLASLGWKKLKPLLAAASVLVLNRQEAQLLVRSSISSKKLLAKSGKKLLVKSGKKLLVKLQQMGPPIVVVTDGARKLYAINHQKIYSFVPPPIPVVETAGAGDAFTSGFLAGLIKDYSFEDALRLGQVNAFSVIQHIGTKNKLLTEKEALESIKKYKIKIALSAL